MEKKKIDLDIGSPWEYQDMINVVAHVMVDPPTPHLAEKFTMNYCVAQMISVFPDKTPEDITLDIKNRIEGIHHD